MVFDTMSESRGCASRRLRLWSGIPIPESPAVRADGTFRRRATITAPDAQKNGLTVAESLRAAGANITEFQIKRQSLEAAYLTIAKARFDKAPAPLRRAA